MFLCSCVPNAHFRWNEEMFAAEVRALRPIARGEEVTMCYIPELENYSSRQARLRDAYGFTCTCELCERPMFARELSDHLRSQLEVLTSHSEELPDARLWAWARDKYAHDDVLLGALEQQVAMMEQELYVRPEGWLTVARPLVKIYCALRNTVAARKWAVCAASYTRAATGTDGGWAAIARTPEKTIWWGVRVAVDGR
jgi:SET domain